MPGHLETPYSNYRYTEIQLVIFPKIANQKKRGIQEYIRRPAILQKLR